MGTVCLGIGWGEGERVNITNNNKRKERKSYTEKLRNETQLELTLQRYTFCPLSLPILHHGCFEQLKIYT